MSSTAGELLPHSRQDSAIRAAAVPGAIRAGRWVHDQLDHACSLRRLRQRECGTAEVHRCRQEQRGSSCCCCKPGVRHCSQHCTRCCCYCYCYCGPCTPHTRAHTCTSSSPCPCPCRCTSTASSRVCGQSEHTGADLCTADGVSSAAAATATAQSATAAGPTEPTAATSTAAAAYQCAYGSRAGNVFLSVICILDPCAESVPFCFCCVACTHSTPRPALLPPPSPTLPPISHSPASQVHYRYHITYHQ